MPNRVRAAGAPRHVGVAALVCGALALSGCQSLLPREDTRESAFARFADAKAAFDAIVPGETTGEELRALGIDPVHQGIAIRPYDTLIRYFVPHRGVGRGFVPEPVLRCFAAREDCQVWFVEATRDKGRRDTWVVLDWLGIHVRKRRSGFDFQGFVIVEQDLARFALYRGRPRYRATDERIRPLGPLQSGPAVKLRPLSSEPRALILGGGKDLTSIELPSPIVDEIRAILQEERETPETPSGATLSINRESP